MSEFEDEELAQSDGDEEDQEEEHREATSDHEDHIEDCSLTQEILVPGLSLLARTGNGLSHAFVKLDLKEKSLTDIALIKSFVHLRFLDLSSNHLSDLSPLANLTQLLWLKIDGNLVRSFRDQPVGTLPYLQWLSLAANRLRDVEGLSGSALETLNLTGNAIQRISGIEHHRLSNLVVLELRGNRLETTDGIFLPKLRHLYLAQNVIQRLEGLDKLERLTTLHLRDNQLETLDGINCNMKSLHYLNVRGNLIHSQRALRSLSGVAQTLRVLVLAENQLAEMDDYVACVLRHLPLLERLDKEPVTAEQKAEAEER
uniref:Leucine-rich repeat-containing protein 23 n=2 Tax=Denticeps clupeoides TaxID=299321 RepID=A0AAY4D6M4_9TELE